jgi:hypothetical protein
MVTMTGSWVDVAQPGGLLRRDWVPAEQPASPDGSAGKWHVVSDPTGGESRWEWHPAPAAVTAVAPPLAQRPAAATPPPPRAQAKRGVPQDLASNIRRGCMAAVFVGALMPWATIGPFAITGYTIKDGQLLMALALGAIALSLAPRRLPVRLIEAAAAVFTLLAAMVDMGNTSNLGAKIGQVMPIKVGAGLVVCVCAAVAWIVALVWEQGMVVKARRRARYVPPVWLHPATP